MPRTARIKTTYSIFHIMCRSISEVDLFKNDKNKLKYMHLIKKYQKIYKFKVYAYCLMDNHLHLIIDSNGADISKIMHSINFCYAMYFNNVNDRHGHLFQDRFKSKIVNNDDYLFKLSAYIHNNPISIKGYENCIERYKFSSLSVYLGLNSDPFNVLDHDYIMSMFGEDIQNSRNNYSKFVYKCDDKKFKEEVEFLNDKTEYRSGRRILVRNYKEKDMINFVSKKMNIKEIQLHTKNNRKVIKAKALLAFLMRSLCNSNCTEICKVLGNITESRVSKFCSIAADYIGIDKYFSDCVEEFIKRYAV